MATTAPIPLPSTCPEKRRMWAELLASFQEIIDLHNQQVAAVLAGSYDGTEYDRLIEGARVRRNRAKARYQEHVAEHGCTLA